MGSPFGGFQAREDFYLTLHKEAEDEGNFTHVRHVKELESTMFGCGLHVTERRGQEERIVSRALQWGLVEDPRERCGQVPFDHPSHVPQRKLCLLSSIACLK